MSMINDATRDPKQLAEFPEYESVDAFIESKFADEDFDVYVWEVEALSYATKTSALTIRKRLTDEGFNMVRREASGPRRGYTAWDNNRWAGNECKGGSGYEQINGFGGQNG
jgi:tRNA U34 5-methylaminomethyl-2-thiouridine-forming methyltransferase MnmC